MAQTQPSHAYKVINADCPLSSDQAMPSHFPNGRMGPMNGEMGLLIIPAAGISWCL